MSDQTELVPVWHGRMRLAVKHLRVGDVLLGTGRTVTQAPTAGMKTPRGKTDLGLDGYHVQFGKETMVGITRP